MDGEMRKGITRIVEELTAIGEEWGIAAEMTGLLITLGVMAASDGYESAEASHAWLAGQGYVERVKDGEGDDPGSLSWQVTEKGVAAAKAWLDSPEGLL